MVEQLKKKWYEERSHHHWKMVLHCKRAIFPRPMPNLQLSSREAHFYWYLYSTTAKYDTWFEKNLNIALLETLRKLSRSKKMRSTIFITGEIVKIERFDYLSRKRVMDYLETFLKRQNACEVLSIENLRLKKSEGLRLLSALFNLRHTLKHLYCWNIFGKMENLISEHHRNVINSKVFFNKYRIDQLNECLKALGSLDKLTTISLNYIYLAVPNEESLIELAKKLSHQWEWLQLLCTKEEMPMITNLYDEVRSYAIPDYIWKKVKVLAPSLKVQIVFIRITGYEQQQHFLTENIPLHTLILSSGVDLETQTPLMVDCFIKLLWSWYPETLGKVFDSFLFSSTLSNVFLLKIDKEVDLNLQLWHQREDLDYLLKHILINLPKLETFKFMGEIKTLQTICVMCCQIQMKQSKVKDISIQIQTPNEKRPNLENWQKEIESLVNSFKNDFIQINVRFKIEFYPY